MTTPTDPTQQSRIEATQTVDQTTIPVVKERLQLDTRERITGQVDVVTTVHTERVDIPLQTVYTRYEERRVPVNRVVEQMPQPRYEGANLIVPVVREEEVVIKRLVLVEEIHLIQHRDEEARTETVDLRHEEVSIRRSGGLNQELTAPLPD